MIISSKQKPLAATYNIEYDLWILDVPHALPDSAVNLAGQYIYKINLDKHKGLLPGDRKDHLSLGLRALENGRLIQRVSGKGDQDLFKATEGTGKIFSFGETK